MKLENREFLKSEAGRHWLIEKTLEAVPKERNWQNFHTPYDLCEYMISKTTLENKTILVLFNVEFLEVLIHKFGVSSESITFLADCRIESELASKVYKVNNTIVNNIDDIEREMKKLKTFDLCFSNPPYTGSMDSKIIMVILPMCIEIVVVHPAAWLLDNKKLSRSYFTKYRNKIKDFCESAYIFDGNSVFNIIGPCSPFTIFKINKNPPKKISVNYFDSQFFEVESVYDITTFGDSWLPIVKPFVEIMEKHSNIWDHSQRILDKTIPMKDMFYFKCRSLLPGSGGNDVWDCLIQLKSPNERYIVDYDELEINKSATRIRYYFETLEEINNFIDYLKTDFVRFCILIYKTNQHFDTGELRLVPWMDFSQEWSDEKLYQFFNIPQQTINYITEIFSDDIYGLRGES